MSNKKTYNLLSGLNVFVTGEKTQKNTEPGKTFFTIVLSNSYKPLEVNDTFLGRSTFCGRVVEYTIDRIETITPGHFNGSKVYELFLTWRYIPIDNVDVTELKRIDKPFAAMLRTESKNVKR